MKGHDTTLLKKLTSSANVEPMNEREFMSFGKFKGERLGDVPAWWLLWVYDQKEMKRTRPQLYAYIEENLSYLEDRCAEDQNYGERYDEIDY